MSKTSKETSQKCLPIYKNNDEDNYLNDIQLQSYFQCISDEISAIRNDIILVEPTVTQLLMYCSEYDNIITLTSLHFNEANYVFFSINNSPKNQNSNGNNGSHWSLLVYSKIDNTFRHYDSVYGLNENMLNFYQKCENGCFLQIS